METLMIGLAFLVVVLVFFSTVAYAGHVSEAHTKKLSHAEEAKFEIIPVYITPENIEEILNTQYQHVMGGGPEHPAVIERKRGNS